jgi:hypothetical protein
MRALRNVNKLFIRAKFARPRDVYESIEVVCTHSLRVDGRQCNDVMTSMMMKAFLRSIVDNPGAGCSGFTQNAPTSNC